MTNLPPPGWYDDPTSPVQDRWWDGERWSEQVRRKAAPTDEHVQGELRDISGFLSHAFGLIRARWDDFLLVAVVAAILMALFSVAFVRPAIDAVEFDGGNIVGWGAAQTWQIVIFVVAGFAIYTVTSMAQYRLAWDAAIDKKSNWSGALLFGVGAAPRFIGWALVGTLPLLGALALLVVMARVAGPIAVLGFFAFFAGAIWWAIVLTFIPAALVVQGARANPIRGAWSVVRRRWWKVFGRVLLIQFIVGLVVQVAGALLAQVAGNNLFGLTLVDAGNNQIEITKDLGSPLDFFVTSAVFLALSLAANIGQVVGVTSISHDVMERGRNNDGAGF